MRSLKIVLSLIFICVYGTSRGQLVNIEAKRMQKDSVRFALKSDVLFDYTDTNGEYIFQIGSNVTTQFKSKDLNKIYFLIGNYKLIRSENQDFQNSWFFHVRYNQKLSDLFRLEAFVQNQNNTLLTITSRSLIGGGIRLKFISNETTKAYFGNSYMYEMERIDATNQQFYNHRNSSYLSINQSFKKTKLDLTGTVYFQPLYRYIGNNRVLCQLKAELPITKMISLSTLLNYFYSSFSPNADDDKSSNLSFGLTFTI